MKRYQTVFDRWLNAGETARLLDLAQYSISNLLLDCLCWCAGLLVQGRPAAILATI